MLVHRINMKLFSGNRAKRSTAFMVLLVWLFALASGVANACLLEERGTHSHLLAAGSCEAAHAEVTILPGHAGAVPDSVDDSDLKALCLKVCDDGSRSLPKHDWTSDQPNPGPAPLVAILWRTVATVIPTLRQMDDLQPDRPGLPIRIRYPRLAL
jgi:hypothetical protein